MTFALLHGEERMVLGDRGYTRNDRNLEAERQLGEPVLAKPFKRMLASLRAKVEHPFRIVKRQLGCTKARYRGLFKNAHSNCTCCLHPC
jgi:IS5 family transposase